MSDRITPLLGTLKIAHIFNDEKFIDSAHHYFELVAPGASQYFLVREDYSAIKYIKTFSPERIITKEARSRSFLDNLNKCDTVVFHSMRPLHVKLLKLLDNRVPVVWVGMGFDYLPLLYTNPIDVYQKKTYELYVKPSSTQPIHRSLYKYFTNAIGIARNPLEDAIYALGRSTFFSPVLEREHRLISAKFRTARDKYKKWNYGINAKLVDNTDDPSVVYDENILIGNSADPRNNHIELFNLLSNYDLENKNIIVPLSYGPSRYREFIISQGKRFFGHRFRPITEFLDHQSYVKMLNSCSYVFMNHNRQQAGGNIIIALFAGAKVFLQEKNLFLSEYRNLGLDHHVLGKITEGSIDIRANTAIAHLKDTRRILKVERGTERQIENTHLLLDSIAKLKLAEDGN